MVKWNKQQFSFTDKHGSAVTSNFPSNTLADQQPSTSSHNTLLVDSSTSSSSSSSRLPSSSRISSYTFIAASAPVGLSSSDKPATASKSATLSNIQEGTTRKYLSAKREKFIEICGDQARISLALKKFRTLLPSHRGSVCSLTLYNLLCGSLIVSPFPTNFEILEIFCATLREAGYAWKTSHAYLSFIHSRHKKDFDPIPKHQMQTLFHALRKDAGGLECDAPFTVNHLRMFNSLELSTTQQTMIRLLSVMFVFLLRGQEGRDLHQSDISFDDQYVTVCIRDSKTDIEGQGAKIKMGCSCYNKDGSKSSSSFLCPYHVLQTQLQCTSCSNNNKPVSKFKKKRKFVPFNNNHSVSASSNLDPYLFTHADGRKISRCDLTDFIDILCELCKLQQVLVGRNRRFYNSHSCRVGGTQCYCGSGVALDIVKNLGRWKSGCVEQYKRDSLINPAGEALFPPLVILSCKFGEPISDDVFTDSD